jgi:hypothetical protein
MALMELAGSYQNFHGNEALIKERSMKTQDTTHGRTDAANAGRDGPIDPY